MTHIQRGVAIAIALVSFAVAPAARADFVNNIETFTGNVKDTNAWEERLDDPQYGSATQQNGYLELKDAEFTSKTKTVGVGQGVRARIARVTTVNQFNAIWYAGAEIMLGTNDLGINGYATADTRVLDLTFAYDVNENRLFSYAFDNANGLDQLQHLVMETTGSHSGQFYNFEIDILSSLQAKFSVWDPSNLLLGTTTLTFPAQRPLPSSLFISLVGEDGRYADITVVPEPSSAALLAVATLSLFNVRRRRRTRARPADRTSVPTPR